MKFTITILIRRLFQEKGGTDNLDGTISASATSDAIFQLINGTSATIKTPFSPPSLSTVNFSVALTILVLVTALSFMALFSAYIHSLATEDSSSYTDNRRRNLSPPLPNNRKGLDPSAIKSLPLVACGVAARHRIEECTICLSEFEDREIVRIIPYCKHMYHPKCIDTWLSLHVTCPLCRSPQLFENVDEVYVVDDVADCSFFFSYFYVYRFSFILDRVLLPQAECIKSWYLFQSGISLMARHPGRRPLAFHISCATHYLIKKNQQLQLMPSVRAKINWNNIDAPGCFLNLREP